MVVARADLTPPTHATAHEATRPTAGNVHTHIYEAQRRRDRAQNRRVEEVKQVDVGALRLPPGRHLGADPKKAGRQGFAYPIRSEAPRTTVIYSNGPFARLLRTRKLGGCCTSERAPRSWPRAIGLIFERGETAGPCTADR